ncbi:MAG: hypothetical protein JST00_41365 [Deltaproteobacteria bacterium]|nr:hypothetical protein [Deltaproteobacteria bacterium]
MKTKPLALMVALTVAAWSAATAGCGSSKEQSEEETQADRDRTAAKNYYVTRVHPALTACQGCHSAGGSGPPIMAKEANESYSTIERTSGLITAPKQSPLVQYLHKDPSVVIRPEERSVTTLWLSLEANARGLEGAVAKPKTITEAYKQFADCMNIDVWTYYRMGDLAFAQTDLEGPCIGCHSTGQGSAWLSAGSRETFDKMKEFPYIQKLVVGKLDDRGGFESLQPSNRLFEKANEVCPPESTSCHPRFGLSPNVTNSIKNFVDTTLQNLATANCNSPIVVNPDAGPRDAGDGG